MLSLKSHGVGHPVDLEVMVRKGSTLPCPHTYLYRHAARLHPGPIEHHAQLYAFSVNLGLASTEVIRKEYITVKTQSMGFSILIEVSHQKSSKIVSTGNPMI